MCLNTPKPVVQPAPVLETPNSETVQRKGEQEMLLRRRAAGIRSDVVTTPLGIPGTPMLGAVT